MIVYPIGSSGQVIVLPDSVTEHLHRHRQIRRNQPEAGGQMFARVDGKRIVVVEATGPRPTDRRRRTTYEPDRKAEKAEIAERHARGLHFIGDWHTHPDERPQPSARDLESMAECVSKSAHCLNGFLLVIVGRTDPPAGLHASLHDGKSYYCLVAETLEPLPESPDCKGADQCCDPR